MTPTVFKTTLAPHSQLHPRIAPGDFIDCYGVQSPLPARDAAEIITSFPGWAMALVRLRGIITAPFGLDQTGPEAEDKLGIFPVETDVPGEIIAGFNDKHLDFRVSVLAHEGHIYLSTWVHRHNLLGRAYLATIMPFHILIARNALARVGQANHLATPA